MPDAAKEKTMPPEVIDTMGGMSFGGAGRSSADLKPSSHRRP